MLMLKMPNPGKDHRQAQPVAGFNRVLVMDGSAWLDDALYSGGGGGFN